MFKTILASAFVAGILLLFAWLMDISIAQLVFFSDLVQLVSWSLMGWFLTGALWVRLPKALAGTWIISVVLALVWYLIYALIILAPFLLVLLVTRDQQLVGNSSTYYHALLLSGHDPAKLIESYNLGAYILPIFQLKIMIYMIFIGVFLSSILRLIAEKMEGDARLEHLSWRGISAAPHFIARLKIIAALAFVLIDVQIIYNYFVPIGGENFSLNSVFSNDTNWVFAWVEAIGRSFSNEMLTSCLTVAAVLIFLPTVFIDRDTPNRFWRKTALLLMSAIWLLASFIGYQPEHADLAIWARVATIGWFAWFFLMWPLACFWDYKLATSKL